MADRLSITDAIDRAGPVLFGGDWIDRLDPSEAEILSKYGPQPRGRPHQSIKPCPERFRVALDRAIGKDHRLGIQRATVLDWIYSARVMIGRNLCEAATLNRKLTSSKRTKPGRGRPAALRQRLIRQMVDDIRNGIISAAALKKLKEEALADRYRASRKACVPARTDALSEAERQNLF
jgi:hypothetical protein